MRPDDLPRPSGRSLHCNRRLAEILVDGGVASRRAVENALRETRARGDVSLIDRLIENGDLKRHHQPFVLHIGRLSEKLQTSTLRLDELLLRTGELGRKELQRLNKTRALRNHTLADALVMAGYPAHRPKETARFPLQPAAAAAVAGAVILGGLLSMLQPSATAIAAVEPSAPLVLAESELGSDDITPTPWGVCAVRQKRFMSTVAPREVEPRFLVGQRKYRPLVTLYAAKYRLPPELLYAMIETESSFNAAARSGDNAVGLMQLIPHRSAREVWDDAGLSGLPTVRELLKPETNIRLGAAYLRTLMDHYFYDVPDENVRLVVALAAYNWGPTRVRAAMRTDGVPYTTAQAHTLLSRYAPVETRNYVRAIARRMEAYSDPA